MGSATRIDFKELATSLLSQAHSIVPSWLPGGKQIGDEYTCASLRGGQGRSCKVNLKTGLWGDFSSTEKGGDLISLYAAINGIKQIDAAKKLSSDNNFTLPTRATTQPKIDLLAPPPGTPDPVMNISSLGEPSMTWTYRSASGDVLFYVARYCLPPKTEGEKPSKEIRAWSWTGKNWVAKSWPAPRPLYGLQYLSKMPDAPVLLVEGEKAADAARSILGSVYVVMTWPNGGNSWTKADWTPILNRRVLIWPDADEPGIKAAKLIAKQLVKTSPEVKFINPTDQPEGWDAADAVAQGWTFKEFAAWAKPRLSICEIETVPEPQKAEQETPPAPPATDQETRDAIRSGFKDTPIETIARIAKENISPMFRLHVNKDTTMLFLVKSLEKKEVERCHNQDLVFEYIAKTLHLFVPGKALSYNNVKKVFETWKLYSEKLNTEPAPFSWDNEDVWSYRRLDFSPSVGKFPAWSEFLVRLSAADDFMAYIWSIFEIRNRSRQFLYLFDPAGQGGKSTVLGVLAEVFGNAFTALNNSMVRGEGNRWLLGNIYGKRLVTWADCKNPKFCMSETVRNITSGDNVLVEFKGENPFVAPMYVKLIIGSNQPPEITGGGADVSRLIRINVLKNEHSTDDPSWRQRLKDELPYFLHECRRLYELKSPNHGDIKLEASTLDLIGDSSSDIESKFEDIAHRRILIGEGFKSSNSEWSQMCREEHLTNQEIRDLKNYVIRNNPAVVRIWRPRLSGVAKRLTEYTGIRIIGLGGGSGHWSD